VTTLHEGGASRVRRCGSILPAVVPNLKITHLGDAAVFDPDVLYNKMFRGNHYMGG